VFHRGTGKYKEAISDLERSLSISPTNAAAHRILALSYEKTGRSDEAEKEYRRATSLRPEYWAGYNDLGIYFHRHKRHAEAAENFKQVIRLAPNNHWGYNNLGAQLLYLGDEEVALEMYERSIEINPEVTAYRNLGSIFYRRGEYASAIPMYEKAVESSQKNYVAWGYLANAQYWAGQKKEALVSWNNMIAIAKTRLEEVNPNSTTLTGTLAAAYAKMGNVSEAERYFNRLLAQSPDDVSTLHSIAELYELLGQREKALHYFSEAFQMGLSATEVQFSPWMKALREDPAFQALIESIK